MMKTLLFNIYCWVGIAEVVDDIVVDADVNVDVNAGLINLLIRLNQENTGSTVPLTMFRQNMKRKAKELGKLIGL